MALAREQIESIEDVKDIISRFPVEYLSLRDVNGDGSFKEIHYLSDESCTSEDGEPSIFVQVEGTVRCPIDILDDVMDNVLVSVKTKTFTDLDSFLDIYFDDLKDQLPDYPEDVWERILEAFRSDDFIEDADFGFTGLVYDNVRGFGLVPVDSYRMEISEYRGGLEFKYLSVSDSKAVLTGRNIPEFLEYGEHGRSKSI